MSLIGPGKEFDQLMMRLQKTAEQLDALLAEVRGLVQAVKGEGLVITVSLDGRDIWKSVERTLPKKEPHDA